MLNSLKEGSFIRGSVRKAVIHLLMKPGISTSQNLQCKKIIMNVVDELEIW